MQSAQYDRWVSRDWQPFEAMCEAVFSYVELLAVPVPESWWSEWPVTVTPHEAGGVSVGAATPLSHFPLLTLLQLMCIHLHPDVVLVPQCMDPGSRAQRLTTLLHDGKSQTFPARPTSSRRLTFRACSCPLIIFAKSWSSNIPFTLSQCFATPSTRISPCI